MHDPAQRDGSDKHQGTDPTHPKWTIVNRMRLQHPPHPVIRVHPGQRLREEGSL